MHGKQFQESASESSFATCQDKQREAALRRLDMKSCAASTYRKLWGLKTDNVFKADLTVFGLFYPLAISYAKM